jgi:hypothetical protein
MLVTVSSPPTAPPSPEALAHAGPVSVRVWDLPTRVFHWLLAAAVLGSLLSAWVGSAALAWHFRFGLMVLALLRPLVALCQLLVHAQHGAALPARPGRTR